MKMKLIALVFVASLMVCALAHVYCFAFGIEFDYSVYYRVSSIVLGCGLLGAYVIAPLSECIFFFKDKNR